jgi:autophagy-related protein 18
LIFDTISLTALNMIQAHKSPIAALAMNAQGTMIATASDKGTVIRTFSIPDGKKIAEYRRGTKSARVFSMNFNAVGSLLAVSSDTETVHIYNLLDSGSSSSGGKGKKLDQGDDRGGIKPHSPPASEAPSSPTLSAISPSSHLPTQNNGGPSHSAGASFSRRSFHLGKNFVAGMGGYLPNRVTEVWEPRRDWAFCKLRGGAGGRSVVAMSPCVIIYFVSVDWMLIHVALKQKFVPCLGHHG